MKIDFSQKLTTFEGAAIRQGETDLTLGVVAVEALMAQHRDENPSGEEKVRRYNLARQIHGAAEASLKAEDVTLIKQLVGKGYLPLVVGQCYELLDAE